MKGLKRFLPILFAFVLAFSLISCQKEEAKKTEIQKGIKITDSWKREVSLDKVPERIVTLSPGATETIYQLGLENKLVGRSDYDDYPAEVSKIPSVGSLTEPNVEKIVELKPDLVITGAHTPKEMIDKIEKLGVKTAVLYGPESFDGAYTNILDIATVLGVKDKGQTIVDNMKKKVAEVESKVKDLKKVKMYYVVGFGKDDYTATGETFISQIIEKAGGDNIAKDSQGWKYSFEKIVENNPEVIVVSDKYDTKKNFVAADRYKDLPAVKANKVLEIDNNMLDRQGPRQADGLEALAKLLHPEAFK